MPKLAKKTPADDIEFFDVQQGSPEWMALRLGLPTASRLSVIMASGKDGGDSIGRAKLLNMLAGEILTGEPAETFRNESMDRGNAMESDARAFYSRTRFVDVEQIGFAKRTIRNPLGRSIIVGASPDGKVGKRKLLEIKTMRPDLLIDVALKGAAGFPNSHRAQCQGNMWVLDCDECDLMLFYRGMPIAPTFLVERDDAFIQKIAEAVEVFDFELHRLVERIQNMGTRR